MQALEGDIDTGHAVFLHLGAMQADDAPPGTWARYALGRRAPRYEVVDTDSGVMYGACRPAEPGTSYWRIANFLFPFWAMVPTGVLGLEVRAAIVGRVDPLVPRELQRLGLAFAVAGFVLIVSGSLATAAGPHSGGGPADKIDRLGRLEPVVYVHLSLIHI